MACRNKLYFGLLQKKLASATINNTSTALDPETERKSPPDKLVVHGMSGHGKLNPSAPVPREVVENLVCEPMVVHIHQ
jgi:hypothetical protein